MDKIPVNQFFYYRFPLSLFKGRLTRQQISAILEMYYFETSKLTLEISGNFNEIFEKIGVPEGDCLKFSQFIEPYIAATNPYDQVSSLLSFLGLENDVRIEKYLSAVEKIQKNKVLKSTLFMGIRVGKVTDRILEQLSSSLDIN